jgi:hypothetical protein
LTEKEEIEHRIDWIMGGGRHKVTHKEIQEIITYYRDIIHRISAVQLEMSLAIPQADGGG